MNKVIKLTPRQSRWVDEMLIDANGAAAAVRAGYSAKSARSIAYENSTKHDVVAVLRQKQALVSNELNVTREGVIRGLREAFEMAKVDRNPSAMISALAALAKLLGFYAVETKRVKLNSTGSLEMGRMSQLSDAELLTIIEAC
jgi:phage terminase small subunit